jgi:hypothetical protein
MCARRRFRRAQTAMEVGGAMSSRGGWQWWAAVLGQRLGVRARLSSGRSTYSRGRSVVSGWGHASDTSTRGKAIAWPATCVAPAANGAPRVVHRSGGLAPPGMAHLPRTSRGSSRRRSAATGGHSGASTCAPDVGTACTAERQRGRARRCGRGRSSVREQKQFAGSVFKIDFLHFLKLKCTLHKIAKLKIIYSSITSAKAVRVFDH